MVELASGITLFEGGRKEEQMCVVVYIAFWGGQRRRVQIPGEF
jgi:hypothetical protein